MVDLDDLSANPLRRKWLDFRPNLKKLILSGAAETEHVAILWYTVSDGRVGLHFHAKTEAVYVIDGTQTDAKGTYPTGTVYFNPPGSGHEIRDSAGFFVLAYASPPDFVGTERIEEYVPVRIDTADPDLTHRLAFEQTAAGIRTFDVPLDAAGGMSGRFLELSPGSVLDYEGSYLLVLGGSCELEGATLGKGLLVVAPSIQPEPFRVAAASGDSCLAMGVSF